MRNERRGRRGRRGRPPTPVLTFIILHSAFCILFLLPGCNVLGVLAYKASGPPKVKPQYVPDKQAPMVVMVENPRNPAAARLDADLLSRLLTEQLRANDVAPVVEPKALADLRSADAAAYRGMPISSVGKAVGARQILYVSLSRFDVEDAMASEMIQGNAEAAVRVVDAETGRTLWPADTNAGYPLSVETGYVRVRPGAAGGAGEGEPAVRERMARAMADRVAKLFYTWTSDTADGGPPEVQ